MRNESGAALAAAATAKRGLDGIWKLTVIVCPLCGRQHHHGGGDGDVPLLGYRVGHCGVPNAGYVLVHDHDHEER